MVNDIELFSKFRISSECVFVLKGGRLEKYMFCICECVNNELTFNSKMILYSLGDILTISHMQVIVYFIIPDPVSVDNRKFTI